MPKIHFHIHYHTPENEYVAVELTTSQEGGDIDVLPLHTYGDGHWMGHLEIDDVKQLRYRYQIHGEGHQHSEGGGYRVIDVEGGEQVFLEDHWKVPNDRLKIFASSAFTQSIFKPERVIKPKKLTNRNNKNRVSLKLFAPDVPVGYHIGITGNIEALGSWSKAILMTNDDFPNWQHEFETQDQMIDIDFKYVWCNSETGDIISWEEGDNRTIRFNLPGKVNNNLIISHQGFRHRNFRWKGAGVAIPVFSMRSKAGFGIGEFLDLKGMIDFAGKCGMNVVQILPVNDTIAAKTYKDSYPYSAISVFALHPLYINVEAIGKFKKKADQTAYHKDKERLNKLDQVDFVAVMEAKLKYLKILFQERGEKVLAGKAFKEYFKENEDWLIPYAAFCYLRDVNGTADFNKWANHKAYNASAIKRLIRKSSSAYPLISFYYFLQFFADQQLKEARDYGRSKKVVLKGDLPIGVYRYSCDAWVAPELYHMDGQAGAPPDDYAEDGQNWGFPTYNWEVMAKDNFRWWRGRMQSLAKYFDALRIDHILGFFRIWEIPIGQISGVMGRFNPRLPFSEAELRSFGIDGEIERYIKPFIREYMLKPLFGEDKEFVKKEFLKEDGEGIYSLQANVTTQEQIDARLSLKKYGKYQHLKAPLSRLVTEVLLLEEEVGNEYNPRITLHKTFSYQALEAEEQWKWNALYDNYYYVRHNEYWRNQAVWKLPALLEATDMLICGEDLGMIPASVPGVMKDLGIISLEIQRMPKGPTPFGVPSQYDYMSVCSPSCHDMSTIRGWWESDFERSQKFFNQHMHRQGLAPESCDVDIVKYINQEHLNAPSILAIFPMQDLLGMDEKLKKEDAASEQINDPANSNHYWRFRLHLNIEDIIGQSHFIDMLSLMIRQSGR